MDTDRAQLTTRQLILAAGSAAVTQFLSSNANTPPLEIAMIHGWQRQEAN